MGFSRQEHWSGLSLPSLGDLPNPGIEPGSPTGGQILYHLSHQRSPVVYICQFKNKKRIYTRHRRLIDFLFPIVTERRKWKQWSPPDPERIKCCENAYRSTAWGKNSKSAAFFPKSNISLKINCEKVCPIFDSHKNHHNTISKDSGGGREGKKIHLNLNVSNGNYSPPAILNLKTLVLLSARKLRQFAFTS